MLSHPTLELLHGLGLHGMADGYKNLEANPEAGSLTHAEWLGIILEHEKTLRQQKRFETRARAAHLRHPASVEDVDYRAHRGLDRALFLKLAGCDWIRTRRNLVITGPPRRSSPPTCESATALSGFRSVRCPASNRNHRPASSVSAPMLWIYAENDSFFGPDIAEALDRSFVAAGGRVSFVQAGPYGRDGHSLFFGAGGSSVWGPVVEQYLAGRAS